MNRAQNLVEDQVRSLTTDTGFIDTQKQDVVRLRGNADFEHSPEIRKILLGAVAGMRNVLVDLSEVTYIDFDPQRKSKPSRQIAAFLNI